MIKSQSPMLYRTGILTLLLMTLLANTVPAQQRARDLGIHTGILTPGHYNAITDVDGVRVGHATRIQGDSVRTGVTVVMPHNGNLFQNRVPAAVYVGNGFGKAVGFTQIQELGELETPVALTNTLSVYDVAAGLADYMLSLPGNEEVRSVNAVVGETNDGWLNDIRARVVTQSDVQAALDAASEGPVPEGNVGAGTGTRALGYKAGIGTSSRVLPQQHGGYTVGVLVQSNFGGVLEVAGVPVGVELGNFYLSEEVPYSVPGQPTGAAEGNPVRETADTAGPGGGLSEASDLHTPAGESLHATGVQPAAGTSTHPDGYDFDVDGSIMIIVATDAPLTSRNLERLARRAFMGIAKTGGFASNGSGDYVIAFSTHPAVRIRPGAGSDVQVNRELPNAAVSPLFLAAVEATEEAILNSLFMAETMSGADGRTMQQLPVDRVLEIIRRYNRLSE